MDYRKFLVSVCLGYALGFFWEFDYNYFHINHMKTLDGQNEALHSDENLWYNNLHGLACFSI